MLAGGPNEAVPEAHKQRNLQAAVTFARNLALNDFNITPSFVQGLIPSIPADVPGMH